MWNICIPNIKLSRRRGAFIPYLQATTGADPGFFLGGAAPLRNGVTDWWPDVNASCIRKPQVISGGGGGRVQTPCTLPLDPSLYYFVYYITTLKTTFWSICRGRFPIACPRFPKNSPEASQTFPNIFRRFPKCLKDCSKTIEKDPKVFRSHTP